MGNRTSTRRHQHQEQGISNDGMSLFDIASLIIHDRMPITPLTVPTCLDELVDWTEEATATANHLTHTGINVGIHTTNPISFVPFVMTRKIESQGTFIVRTVSDMCENVHIETHLSPLKLH